ncbi:MAG: rhodanese-like domain-containing protein [Burkholderiales bacterium]
MNQLGVQQLAEWLADAQRQPPVILDVREAWEVGTAALPEALHVPMREIPNRADELDRSREIVALCHHGARSMQVAIFLERLGFTVHNLAGGIDAWSREVDASVPRY